MFSLDQFRVDGRVTLVTGAGRGIGLAIAQALAMGGAKVAIQDIDLDVATAEAQALTAQGHTAIALGGDAKVIADADDWVKRTTEQLGPIDILVNNASIQSSRPLEEWTPDQVDELLRANVTSPWRVTQLVIPHMREQQWGRILNIGSIQAIRGYLGMGPYSASKAAIHNFTNAFARALGKDGITVNCIAPGYYNTYRNRDHFAKHHAQNNKVDWLPLRRVGEPVDCAGAALLLCSDAGSYITGAVLHVDGGMHISG
jgi:NAD(P)-dependent dehydrogenase (short-subunit alcohol dehydrogenase family)